MGWRAPEDCLGPDAGPRNSLLNHGSMAPRRRPPPSKIREPHQLQPACIPPPICECSFSKIRDAFAHPHQPHFANPVGVLNCCGMNRDDVKEIKNIIDTALETHLGSVHEEISDLRTEVKKDLSELEERVTASIEKVDKKLGAFEDNEIDKRLQLEVRVSRVEKRLRLSKAA